MQAPSSQHATIEQLVINSLCDVLTQNDRPIPEALDGSITLIGKQAVLNSLALVTLIVEMEQQVEEKFDVALSLTDDRAMSQKHSPFRTVATLTEYIVRLLDEEQGRG